MRVLENSIISLLLLGLYSHVTALPPRNKPGNTIHHPPSKPKPIQWPHLELTPSMRKTAKVDRNTFGKHNRGAGGGWFDSVPGYIIVEGSKKH
ncbi:hypothetical protein CROQUDRAFT_86614 [Cronartium quercuum f. sp. fusiforme G11]|uniref:Uncharacterized protein n=1 Tax=Cronartium quercuum f. sp. fusiforme G11 TaxID=708437 RepID=A0A9P6THA9_9BASI|nr:hypothetical protein CROQUDRAFT_86614 [Cronartium quercuum f. sp. fusiforme G11]